MNIRGDVLVLLSDDHYTFLKEKRKIGLIVPTEWNVQIGEIFEYSVNTIICGQITALSREDNGHNATCVFEDLPLQ